jgi:membrane protein DedA with SNARE-associated domain
MPIAGTLTEIHATLLGLSPVLVALLAALAVSIETSLFVGLLIPGDLMLLVAGTTATSPARFALLVVAGIVGSLVGEAVGYWIGHRFGHRIRRSRVGQKIGEPLWRRTERFMDRFGPRAIVLARFMPGIHAVVPVVTGSVRYPFRRFIRWAAVAAVVWSTVYVGAGALAGAHLPRVQGSLGLIGYVVLVMIALVVLGKKLANKWAPADFPETMVGSEGKQMKAQPALAAQSPMGGDR